MFGAELFTQTAATAAGTMAGLMTTDAWQAARHRIARILRREDVERLERARAQLGAAPPGQREVILREQRDDLDTTLRGLLARDPALSGPLTEFVEEFSGPPASRARSSSRSGRARPRRSPSAPRVR